MEEEIKKRNEKERKYGLERVSETAQNKPAWYFIPRQALASRSSAALSVTSNLHASFQTLFANILYSYRSALIVSLPLYTGSPAVL